MRKVYIVIGSQGEYSDHRMWHVRGYDSKADADAEAARLTALMVLLTTDREGKRSGYFDSYEQERDVFAWIQSYDDPSVSSFYSEHEIPAYGVIEVDVEEATP